MTFIASAEAVSLGYEGRPMERGSISSKVVVRPPCPIRVRLIAGPTGATSHFIADMRGLVLTSVVNVRALDGLSREDYGRYAALSISFHLPILCPALLDEDRRPR